MEMKEPIQKQPKICARCGATRTDDIDSNICGSCADDLRMEEIEEQANEGLSGTGTENRDV